MLHFFRNNVCRVKLFCIWDLGFNGKAGGFYSVFVIVRIEWCGSIVENLSTMAGLEELKKKLVPLFDAEKGFSSGSTLDPSDSYMVILHIWRWSLK